MDATQNMIPDSFPVELNYTLEIVKAQPQSGDWVVEGFVATSDIDLQGDSITPEGLAEGAETLNEAKVLLWNHDPDSPIGKILEAKVKSNGIWIKAILSKTADKIWTWVKEGIINRFSIRGEALASAKAHIKGRVVNLLTKLRLVEASLVSLPANPQAQLERFYVAKAFESHYKPQELPFEKIVEPIASGMGSFEGMLTTDGFGEDILDALQKSSTVCLNNDDGVPVGVIEDTAKIDDSTIYMKIRFSSLTPDPGGRVVVRGGVIKSGETALGFVPRGVWVLNKELNMSDTKKSLSEGKAGTPLEEQGLAEGLKELKSEFAELKALLMEKAEKPEEEEEVKAEKPEEEEEEEEEVKAEKPEEEENPKEEPSSEADSPKTSLTDEKDPYPEPPSKKAKDPMEDSMKAVKRAFKILASLVTKGGMPDNLQKNFKVLQREFDSMSDEDQRKMYKSLVDKKETSVDSVILAKLEDMSKAMAELKRNQAVQKGDGKREEVVKSNKPPIFSGAILGPRTAID